MNLLVDAVLSSQLMDIRYDPIAGNIGVDYKEKGYTEDLKKHSESCSVLERLEFKLFHLTTQYNIRIRLHYLRSGCRTLVVPNCLTFPWHSFVVLFLENSEEVCDGLIIEV